MIRKATLQDIEQVTDLILMASSCLFEDILKTTNENRLRELVMQYYVTVGTKFYFENIIVYEADNKAVGALVSYPADMEKTLNKRMASLLENDYEFDLEGITGTKYLDSMAVNPKYQGRGISRALLGYVIDRSDVDMSLLVETYKKSVEAYYRRVGFEEVEVVNLFNTELKIMVYHI